MENVLNLTPLQTFFALALNTWIFIIFPVLIIKKINYMTDLLESQFDDDGEEE